MDFLLQLSEKKLNKQGIRVKKGRWTLQFEVLTDIGRKRTVNEDSAAVYTLPGGIILAVAADGMGGHRGGDYASSTAVKVIGEQFMKLDSSTFNAEENWAEWLQEAIIHVNAIIYKFAWSGDK